MSDGQLIALSMLWPALAAVAVALLGRAPNLRDGASSVATLLTFGTVVQLVPRVNSGARPSLTLMEVMPGVSLHFEVEPLGMVYALVASGLWIITALYAVGYMRGHHEENQTRFFFFFALAISAALGIAYAGNLFTLFLFYEVLTFSTFPLVTHHGTDAAKRAGRVYLGILVSTSVGFLLLAVLWTYFASGTLDFRPGGILAGKLDGAEVPILLGLYAFGTGKAALMPFHRWLPAAMVAPTPVSALLHAVAVVKAGVFSVLKIVVYVFGLELLQEGQASLWLMYVAAGTILISSVVALTKDNLKARLAYSTISQLAYIVLGAALATGAGVIGGGMHIAMHAVGKITLFFCAGAIYVAAHKTEISTMNGIGRRMPFTMGAFLIGSLSIIGLPPLGGSWSKWYLALGAAEGHNEIFILVLMLSSLLSIGYLMPVVVRAFFYEPEPDAHHGEHAEHAEHGGHDEHGHHAEHGEGMHEAPFLCVAPICAAAVGCVALFFTSQYLHALLLPIAGGQ
ncbi:MAG: proton-conducting transporter membrane subunit [Myxococcales bacterium]|nr:proton-conducting transporter membrane subunit [Myxococcales bacterium]